MRSLRPARYSGRSTIASSRNRSIPRRCGCPVNRSRSCRPSSRARAAHLRSGRLRPEPHSSTRAVAARSASSNGSVEPVRHWRTWARPATTRRSTLSRDGTQIVAEVRRDGAQPRSTLVLLGTSRTAASTVTTGELNDTDPRIGPDGDVVFARNTGDVTGIVRSDIAGGALSVLVPKGKFPVVWLEDWAGASGGVIYRTSASTDAWQLISGMTEPRRLTRAREPVEQVQLSPGGRWIAYNNADSGRAEVYLSPVSGSGQRWQASDGGGVQAIWSASGAELYYLSLNGAVNVVDVQTGGAGTGGVEVPRPVSDAAAGHQLGGRAGPSHRGRPTLSSAVYRSRQFSGSRFASCSTGRRSSRDRADRNSRAAGLYCSATRLSVRRASQARGNVRLPMCTFTAAFIVVPRVPCFCLRRQQCSHHDHGSHFGQRNVGRVQRQCRRCVQSTDGQTVLPDPPALRDPVDSRRPRQRRRERVPDDREHAIRGHDPAS